MALQVSSTIDGDSQERKKWRGRQQSRVTVSWAKIVASVVLWLEESRLQLLIDR